MTPLQTDPNLGISLEISETTRNIVREMKTQAEALRERIRVAAGQILPSLSAQAVSASPDLTKTTPSRSQASIGMEADSRGAETLASRIDHTILKPDARREEISRICDEARAYGFATVCVNSAWIPFVADNLKGCNTLPIAVVGFPLGAASSAAKAFETRQAVADGAREIDMVVALGPLKDHEYETVFRDIQSVVEAAHPYPVKVILETSLLQLEDKIAACCIAQAAGAAFVKTSTGFGGGGASVEDIALMRYIVGPDMGVKASGGIRSFSDARKMLAAGANRIGASASVAIVSQQQSEGGGY